MRLILITVVQWFFEILRWAILIDCILSFISTPSLSEIRRILYNVLRPVYSPIRKLIERTPLAGSMLDFTPLFSLILLSFLSRVIISVLVMVL